ncbi:MAG: type II toxin-antitoxin system PemK/MazF family toxin, partial [Nanoarchaeota archaeon]
IIAIGITSNISKDKYTLDLDNKDLKDGKLMTKCVIKVENILRLDKSLIVKKIGKIKEEKLDRIIKILNDIIKV